jgi:hypothetical protein
VDLPLAPARTVEVSVVEKGTGRPLPGATFDVRYQLKTPGRVSYVGMGPLPPVAPTDAGGRTLVEGTNPDDRLQLLHAVAPGFDSAGFSPWTTVEPGGTEARLEMVGPREIRFPVIVKEGEAPVPPDGAGIRLLPIPGSGMPDPAGSARMEGATLVVENASAGGFGAVANAPDGSVAILWADDKRTPPSPVHFRLPRTVEVLARNPDGSPAEGAAFVLFDEGPTPIVTPAGTDAAGRVAFPGLHANRIVSVFLLPDLQGPYGGRPVGKVDLRKGDGRLEVVVPGKRTFLAHVTVDGVRRLPPVYRVSAEGIQIRDAAEDPEKGEIRFDAFVEADAAAVQVSLWAYPYLGGQVKEAPVPGEGPIDLDIALRSPGSLTVAVRPPPDGLYRLCVQHWDTAEGQWQPSYEDGDGLPMHIGPDAEGIARAPRLREGRYRVLEGLTGLVTDPVDVHPGSESAAGALDLSKSGWAQGRVVVPGDGDAGLARVLVEGPGLVPATREPGLFESGDRHRIGMAPDGSFKARIPGDRTVTLRPWHPVLAPAPEGGCVEVMRPQEGLVLRLAGGAQATMRLTAERGLQPYGWNAPRVLVFQGAPLGTPRSEHPALVEGDRLTFGGFKPGTWTLLVDITAEWPDAFAPAILRDIELGSGETDLGTIRLTGGSRLRVRVLAKDGVEVPRFRMVGPPLRFDRVVELDGTNDMELVLDLR